jgi:hypothetical protein
MPKSRNTNALRWQKVSQPRHHKALGILASPWVSEEYSRFLELRKLLGAHDDHLEGIYPLLLTVKLPPVGFVY